MSGVGIVPSKDFPKLYSISWQKESAVTDVISFSDGRLHWDVQVFRLVQDWELESLALFMDMIYSTSVRGNCLDKSCWKPVKSREFEVCGYYHSLSPSNVMPSPGKCCGK